MTKQKTHTFHQQYICMLETTDSENRALFYDLDKDAWMRDPCEGSSWDDKIDAEEAARNNGGKVASMETLVTVL